MIKVPIHIKTSRIRVNKDDSLHKIKALQTSIDQINQYFRIELKENYV